MTKIDENKNLKPIFLIGFMGSGKTTFGKKLAKELGYTFVDSDVYIEEQEKMSISDIFNQKGETYFRKIEQEAIETLSHQVHAVVATGGGAPCFHDNISLMNAVGLTCYLQLSPKKLALRLRGNSNDRPLVASKDDNELLLFIEEKLKDRKLFYQQAQYIVDADTPENLLAYFDR